MGKDINEPIRSMLIREYDRAINEFIEWAYIDGIDFSFTGKIKEDGTSDVSEKLETIKQRFLKRKQSEEIANYKI